MAAATKPKLVNVFDVREIDWNTGERLPLEAGEGHTCERCGKLHAKVFVVEHEGKTSEVGSTCCKRLFGWQPMAEEVQRCMARVNGVKVAEQVLAIDRLEWMTWPAVQSETGRLSGRFPNWAWVYQSAIVIVKKAVVAKQQLQGV